MTYRQVRKKLKKLGCVEIRRRGVGSHRPWHNPSNDRFTTVPHWDGKDLKVGTLRAVVRQLGPDWQTFQGR